MRNSFNKILLIQTAFTGDVILATSLLEMLHERYPAAQIDVLVRKGNESLLEGHPFVGEVLVFNKKKHKALRLFMLAWQIRNKKYDAVFNLQRHFSSGLISGVSGAGYITGFNKNPLSFLYSNKVKHRLGSGKDSPHEIERNAMLFPDFQQSDIRNPKLYINAEDEASTAAFKTQTYVCISPASVWFTKQLPAEKWVELIQGVDKDFHVFLLGGKEDHRLCEQIRKAAGRDNVVNVAGKLKFLESASLMRDARMNFTNDSAPTHLASAVNAPVTTVYCSTIPEYGFVPLSADSAIVECSEKLDCRPCGLHGYKKCPLGHFKCGKGVNTEDLLKRVAVK